MADTLRGPSRTAMLTAVARALHREGPPPIVLDDEFALAFSGEEGAALRERLQAELPPALVRAFSRWVCVRSRFAEDLAGSATVEGVNQYVILGAGLDSFAYRRADLLQRLRVFEVDHPASQSWKRDRLRQLGVASPANLMFTPVDFERQTLREGLEATGFDFERRAVFAWIGVTMYLSLDAIEATLATIAQCPPGSRVALTYNQPPHVLDGFSAQVTAAFSAIAAEMGEPFVSLFVSDEIDELLRGQGFDEIMHFGPQEALTTYFGGQTDLEIAGAQRLAEATVRSPIYPDASDGA